LYLYFVKLKSVLYSYAIGLPVGVSFGLIAFFSPKLYTGFGFSMIPMHFIYGAPSIVFLVALAIALFLAGIKIPTHLSKYKFSTACFLYSFKTNAIVWSSFALATYINLFNKLKFARYFINDLEEKKLLFTLIPIAIGVVSVIICSFTVAPLVLRKIK